MQNEKISAAQDFLSVIKSSPLSSKILYPTSVASLVNAANATPSQNDVFGINLISWQEYAVVMGCIASTLAVLKTLYEFFKERKKGGK
jgi:hypothetical protein